jgi:hypothetical protein
VVGNIPASGTHSRRQSGPWAGTSTRYSPLASLRANATTSPDSVTTPTQQCSSPGSAPFLEPFRSRSSQTTPRIVPVGPLDDAAVSGAERPALSAVACAPRLGALGGGGAAPGGRRNAVTSASSGVGA